MPLPFIIGAAIAGAVGVGSGIRGAAKMKEANDTLKGADYRHRKNLEKFKEQDKTTNEKMDKLGETELKILRSFETFSLIFEKIQNKPKFKEFEKSDFVLPEYSPEDLKKVSIGAGVLLGGIGGAAIGTAGGFAAAGATTAAVMALGTASTGTAIASLSGAAAVNATLAAIGGGALAAGGGGVALGSAILGGATLGVGLLVGGIIFNITGSSLSNKADEAWNQMKKAEENINKICNYLKDLSDAAEGYCSTLSKVNEIYIDRLGLLRLIVDVNKKCNWNDFTNEEKLLTQNTVLLVGLLYNMCKVNLVIKSENETEINKINTTEINKSVNYANEFIENI